MIDGVHIDDHVLLVALGIDSDGKKHVLGIREGATENTAACTALLTDLRERNLCTDRTTLIVLDGAKALAKAVRELFGARGLIQRCQCHKIRNVLDQLPEEMRASVRQAMREAYGCGDAGRAKKVLTNLARRLRDDHPGAAASLDEGLDETLTVDALRPPSLPGARPLDDKRDREPDRFGARSRPPREALARRTHDRPLDRHRRRRRCDALPPRRRRARRHVEARDRAARSRCRYEQRA